MIIAIVTNFALIFSSTILIYLIFSNIKKIRRFTTFERRLQSILIGVGFGLISLVITILFLDLAHNVLVNTRFIMFIISGLLGGPVAMFVNAIFIFLIRFFLNFDTTYSLIISFNALLFGSFLSLVAIYKPITLKSIHYYFALILAELTILLLYINSITLQAISYISLYICYSITLYSLLLYVIKYLDKIKYNAGKSEELSKVDFITQLPNNFALENRLQYYIDHQIPFEMVHLDVDLFKNFNMEHGYRQGDQLLSKVARTIWEFAKQHDAYVARIGGDEFCYVICNSNPAIAITEVHQLSKVIEETIYTIDNVQVQITISASIISYPHNATTLSELYTASNYALRMITESRTNTIKHINQIKQDNPTY
ncbi:MAG: diguanylate cyclase [Lysinibacillus sp.]